MSLLTVSGFVLGVGIALLIYNAGLKAGIKGTFLFFHEKAKEQLEKERLQKIADLTGKGGQS